MLREMSPTLTFVESGLQFEVQGVEERKQSLHWDCALGSGSGHRDVVPSHRADWWLLNHGGLPLPCPYKDWVRFDVWQS